MFLLPPCFAGVWGQGWVRVRGRSKCHILDHRLYIFFPQTLLQSNNWMQNSLSLGYLPRTDTGCLSDGDKLKQFSTVVVGLF